MTAKYKCEDAVKLANLIEAGDNVGHPAKLLATKWSKEKIVKEYVREYLFNLNNKDSFEGDRGDLMRKQMELAEFYMQYDAGGRRDPKKHAKVVAQVLVDAIFYYFDGDDTHQTFLELVERRLVPKPYLIDRPHFGNLVRYMKALQKEFHTLAMKTGLVTTEA